ncbi:AIPR family protein, partial [Enterococcus faecalis]|nr:AIPR family protein [Enterococcus faecalis]
FLTVAPYISDIDKKNTLSSTNSIAQDVLDAITVFHEILMKNASKFPNVNITFVHASRGDTDQIDGPNKTNDSYLQKIKDLENIILTNNLGGKTTVNYRLLGAEELKDLAQYVKSYSGDLKLNENPIFVEYGDEGVQKGYIATVYLKDYFEFLVDYDKNGKPVLKEYLFESNIRDYQNKTAVNKDIEATLIDTKKENDFWWLNNGITILADEGSLVGKTFSLENIQIVNGLQTSHSIYHALKNTDYKEDKRTIFCKVIITQNNTSRDTIIKATNFQNSVPASSLRSTDIIQRDIEKYLLQKGLYYDRRKNYYKNKGKSISKIISINYLSQALTAVLQSNPAKARTNPTVLTKKDEDYKRLFNKHTSIE